MWSYHPLDPRKNDYNGKLYAKQWKLFYDTAVEQLAGIVLRYASSPMQWLGGHRKKENFLAAEWIGIDIDHGATISEVLNSVIEFTHIVGLTRSHQQWKGKEPNRQPPCDRMRVFLKLDQVVTDLDIYESTVKFYATPFKADTSAMEAARLFWPCDKIVSVAQGKLCQTAPAPPKRQYKRHPRAGKTVPRTTLKLLESGVDKNRNDACYYVGLVMTTAGYSIDEICDVIMASPIPINCSAAVLKEVRDTVSSAAKVARK